MIARRDFFVGGACLAAAGLAYGLIPRRHVTLLGGARLEEIVPRVTGDWASHDVTDLVAPKIEGSLLSKLYGQTVGRVYRRGADGAEIMMLLAYGNTQSDDLQLHRPEICYPAFGFAISQDFATSLPLASRIAIPSRQLVATAGDHRENIVYWSRLGEFFPIDRQAQQIDRLKTAMHGVVADGLLARFSILNLTPDVALGTIRGFVETLVMAVAPDRRAVLVGTERAAALLGAGP
ncbi:MAG: exosortase-associated protein EpsI, V-type [Caulobacteraceae bacterium]